ncbi:alpha/beta hydrolase [Legionella cardiaca]|uniref:Alpha/beta hydrolase n=1 Tax=Legionella cardiaca TaxID=1071983 RepID=A0ABY8AWC4_9GAMM|nr:alpha/beta hydrolase [Legionella cardiaca]WED43432.1 alpha/beta hydrolase [Legionella cardiaca]
MDSISSLWKYVKKKQPVSTTGAVAHTYYWLLTLMSGDIVYVNPNFKPDPNDSTGGKGVVIYCVHGTADNPGSFIKAIERLIEEGLPSNISAIYLVSFDNRYQGKGIKFFSRELINKVVANGHKDVAFMGHSRGGLIISHAAEYRAPPLGIKVHFLFPICAPFGGSYWAIKPISIFSTSVAQMEINADLLKDLNQVISNSDNKYYFIGAEEDAIVLPEATYVAGYLEKKPGCRLVLDRHGHLSIMSSHRLVAYVHETLHGIDALKSQPKPVSQVATDFKNEIEKENEDIQDLFDDFMEYEPKTNFDLS